MITVVLLALLVLALYALSALGRVGSDTAATAVYQTQARQNALLGLSAALGELQRHAGNDEAITGIAGVAGVPAGADNPARHWCGVWEGNGGFRGWLVSGAAGQTIPLLTGADSIALLSTGALGADGVDKEHVRSLILPVIILDAAGMPVRHGGYAWWVGDEGVKLSAVVPDADAPVPGERHAIDELIPALAPTATELSRVEVYAQLGYVPSTPLTPGQLQSNLHGLGRTHYGLVSGSLLAGRFNVNSNSARYWRGVGATYNRLRPAHQLGISPTTLGNRVRDHFVAAAGIGKDAGGPFLSADAFFESALLDTVLQGSDVTPEEFRDALQPWFSVRSDTFRIRVYGEAVNPAEVGRVEASAYCEAMVQRMPEALPVFGRRFVIHYFRWLGPEDL